MLRTTKHNISQNANEGKLRQLDSMFVDCKHDLEVFINYIIDGVLPLKLHLSSKQIPTERIKHSKYKRDLYAQASQIIRSQIQQAEETRYKEYKKVYAYFKANGCQSAFISTRYKELNKKDILKTRHFKKPNLDNITISLTNEFYDIQEGKSFDQFFSIKLPFFNEKGTRALKVNVPLKHHRQSNKFKEKDFNLKNTITLKKIDNTYFINLIWEKHVPTTIEHKQSKTVGIDTGFRKLIATSEGQVLGNEMPTLYKRITTAKRNSRNYKNLLKQRDNLVNFYCNQINLDGIDTIVVEDLKNVKFESNYNSKVNDLLSRWTYRAVLLKIERICEVHGIRLEKVSPAYTSQTCSLCGEIHKESRQGDVYKCVSCGYEIDADINAAINIRNKGVSSPLDQKSDFCVETLCSSS